MYKIFSHNDLDGYSVNTICDFYKIDADIKNINNKVVNEELMNFFKMLCIMRNEFQIIRDRNSCD